jgi:hypothetical protein
MVSLLVATDVGEGLHSRLVGLSSANADGALDGAPPLVELEWLSPGIGGD